jgi:glycosyltransferase involved in cell wall biosynthesis
MSDQKILIIVPAFNEEHSVGKTIREIQACRLRPSIVVIDDGSSDRTASVAKEAGADVILLPFNLGIGGAVQTGFRYAEEQGFDIAVQVDGDGQHDVKFLDALLQPVVTGAAEMSIGSRFLPPFLGYRSSFVRRIGIHFFANLITVLIGSRVTDPTSGFRAFNRRMIKIFAQYYPYDFPEPEAIMVARRYGATIVEAPVRMRQRQGGVSSIRYVKTLQYMLKVTFAILLDKLKHKREIP